MARQLKTSPTFHEYQHSVFVTLYRALLIYWKRNAPRPVLAFVMQHLTMAQQPDGDRGSKWIIRA